jgi:DNA-binding CsgD family transcriptional regulator
LYNPQFRREDDLPSKPIPRPNTEPSAFLVLVNVSDEDWSYKIDAQRKILGRSATATIRLPDRFDQVSRFHAEVWRDNDRNWLRDIGSLGGTHVNGICVEKGQAVTVTIGDRIALSDVELKVVAEVSKLAKLMVEAGIAVLSESPKDESSPSGTDIQRTMPLDFVRSMLRQLTAAELDIVLWMYRGYTSDEELGRTLHRSPNTVRTQVGSIFGKLNLHSRTDIVSWLKRASSPAHSAARKERRDPAPTNLEIPMIE